MNFDELKHKQYIGDSVYVGHDGYHVWIYTDNGFGPRNSIALEPDVFDALVLWNKRRKETSL